MPEAAKARAAAAHGGAGTLDRGETRGKFPQRNLRFHPSERIAGAGVNAAAEGEVPIGRAADIEPVGIWKLSGVAIGL